MCGFDQNFLCSHSFKACLVVHYKQIRFFFLKIPYQVNILRLVHLTKIFSSAFSLAMGSHQSASLLQFDLITVSSPQHRFYFSQWRRVFAKEVFPDFFVLFFIIQFFIHHKLASIHYLNYSSKSILAHLPSQGFDSSETGSE